MSYTKKNIIRCCTLSLVFLFFTLVESHDYYCVEGGVDSQVDCANLYAGSGGDSLTASCVFQDHCAFDTDVASIWNIDSTVVPIPTYVWTTPNVWTNPNIWINPISGLSSCRDITDGLINWVDSENESCSTYTSFPELCSSDPHLYANNGFDATMACCKCGGGSTSCRNFPFNWQDVDGYTCSSYSENEWCLHGGLGPRWEDEWGNLLSDVYSDQYGTNVVTACCACGGGKEGDNPLGMRGYRRPRCHNYPFDWQDTYGYRCSSYSQKKWCLNDGVGPEWNVSWGSLEDFSDQYGNSVVAACCACGGGKDGDSPFGMGGDRRRLREEAIRSYNTTKTMKFPFGMEGNRRRLREEAVRSYNTTKNMKFRRPKNLKVASKIKLKRRVRQ